MGRVSIILLLLLMMMSPATAHSLRLFAKVDGDIVSGYAFFIGGGRPSGANWLAKTDNQPIASGTTDAGGGYRFTVSAPVTKAIVITVDTGEGHIATTTLAAERFSTPAAGVNAGTVASCNVSAQWVESAVARQIGPLLERIEEMDARMRLTDVMAGIFLIIGLAGAGLWIGSRRR